MTPSDSMPQADTAPADVTQNSVAKSNTASVYSAKYSATGGTGGIMGLQNINRSGVSPTRVLGDFQMNMVNKAFENF